jgi:hypothetical protein
MQNSHSELAGIISLLPQDFTPRINLSDSDFFHLTLNGYSCLTAHETADSKFYALNLQIAFDQFIPQGPSNRT